MVINVVLIIIGVFIYLIGLYMTGFTSKPKRWKTVMGIVLIFIGTIIAIAGIDQVVRQLFLLFF